MRKILIFTASTGEGHNQVARALKNEFEAFGYEVVMMDILKETSQVLNLCIADGYNILATHLPKIYGMLYKWSDRKIINIEFNKIFNRLEYHKVYNLITYHQPDLIITTHPFIIGVIGDLKKKGMLHIPFISVVTDYKAHQVYIHDYVDAYITGSDYTSQTLVERGINSNNIYACGIPIRRQFLKRSIDYKKDSYFTVLLMGGSMGVKGMKKVLENLIGNRNLLRIIVICGNNKSLKKKIIKQYHHIEGKEIRVYGFTKDIPQFMDKAHIVITKPGGITVSESMAKNIPMIIPYFIPGQEEGNVEFLLDSGVAIQIKNIDHINEVIDELIQNPKKLEHMKKRMKDLWNIYSIENIIELSNKLMWKYSHERGMIYGK
ncbi:MGDG synthase family glycosyltransferase [Inediibacterium massiliense]|uniref:MGDG synthase family glycosyltransferase n=1 Tax=Inediibacterium massiliense TaxID=1658111 RepID=UPI0006B4A564|nr:glycosyltransferase [Inediibacterium massiliense]